MPWHTSKKKTLNIFKTEISVFELKFRPSVQLTFSLSTDPGIGLAQHRRLALTESMMSQFTEGYTSPDQNVSILNNTGIVFFSERKHTSSYSSHGPSPLRHGPLTREVKLRVAHAPDMPGTFSPPPWVSEPDMHHDTCVMHVSWCMPGSLTSGFIWSRLRRKNVPGIPGACATRNLRIW